MTNLKTRILRVNTFAPSPNYLYEVTQGSVLGLLLIFLIYTFHGVLFPLNTIFHCLTITHTHTDYNTLPLKYDGKIPLEVYFGLL